MALFDDKNRPREYLKAWEWMYAHYVQNTGMKTMEKICCNEAEERNS